jgi:hypothetical protein
MWLLDTSKIELVEFVGKVPPYAILSHTWGDEEVSFQDLQTQSPSTLEKKKNKGYAKIKGTCQLALDSGLGWAWVDTCCIDKASSAELSEAINSMFQWYKEARVCYAYLADVHDSTEREPFLSSREQFADVHHDSNYREQFSSSRWFTRGWTLQELLAPSSVVFYASNWDHIGGYRELVDEIASVTGIERQYLLKMKSIQNASVAQRMSWAAKRETTRVEDRAYSLLGLFDVSMPLIYGEGKKAFLRLQEEIMKKPSDQSIFAFGYGIETRGYGMDGRGSTRSCLAVSPAEFVHAGDIVYCDVDGPGADYVASSRHITLTAPLCRQVELALFCIPLMCRPRDEVLSLLAIPVITDDGSNVVRVHHTVALVPREVWSTQSVIQLHFKRADDIGFTKWMPPVVTTRRYALRRLPVGLEVLELWPLEQWLRPRQTNALWRGETSIGYARLRWVKADPAARQPDLILKLDAALEECTLAEFPSDATLADFANDKPFGRYPAHFGKMASIGAMSIVVEMKPSFHDHEANADLHIVDLVSSLCKPWSLQTYLLETSGVELVPPEERGSGSESSGYGVE